MALTSSVRAIYDTLRKIDYTNFINFEFVGVGLPFAEPVRILQVNNYTDAILLVSFDGVTPHTTVPRQGDWIHDFGSNQSLAGGLLELPAGFRFYVMGVDDELNEMAPTSGSVAVTVIYAGSR